MGRLKEYSPSIWGLILYGYDKLTGLTELPELEAVIRDLGGTPDRSGKTHAERNKDYFHPIWGAADRWKASMNNGTNPFIGIGRTVVPAVAFGTAAYYLPQATAAATRAVPQAVKAVALHPRLIGKAAKTGAINVGKSLVKGIIGGKAVDLGTETITGKDWGEFTAPYLGVSKELADWTNPGYLLGGKNLGITNTIKLYKTNKKLIPLLLAKDTELALLLLEVKNLKKTLEEAIGKQLQLKLELLKKYNDASDAAGEVTGFVENIRPISSNTLKRRRLVIAEHNRVFKGDLNLENKNFRVEVSRIPVGEDLDLGGVQNLITFKNPNGTETTSPLTILSKPPGKVNVEGQEIPFYISNGKLVLANNDIIISLLRRFGNIIEGNTSNILKGIGDYVTLLENVMGEDGTVAGSLIHYKNGILKGTQTESGLIGPADTEIYTTLARLPQLLEKLQFNLSRNNSTGGLKGTSPHTFRNNDSAHNGVDTEINIIEADANGNAKGKIAHQIYRALWPEKYSLMLYDTTMSGRQIPASEISLPISAENLLQHLKKNPLAMLLHLLVDMVGMETFTRPLNVKASKRLFSVLFNPDNLTPLQLHNALQAHGKYNLGSLFKLGSELYPNIVFNDVEANKAFLKTAYGLTDEELSKIASNPDIVRNAFDLYNFLHSTSTRMLGNDVLAELADNGQRLHNPIIEMFTGNGAFSGGQMSGPGLNTTLLNPFGGWRAGQSTREFSRNTLAISLRPLTYNPEQIKTPMDLVKLIEHLRQLPDNKFYEGELAGNVRDKSVPYKYNMERSLEIENMSRQEDRPVYLSMGNYGFGYSGGFAKPISSGARYVTEADYPELGSLFKDIADGTGIRSLWKTIEEAPQSVKDFLKQLESLGNEDLKKFIEKWGTMTLEERIKILKDPSVTISEEGKPYYSIFDILNLHPKEVKRHPYDYNTVGVILPKGQDMSRISALEIQEHIRPTSMSKYRLGLDGNYGELSLEELDLLARLATKLWSEYTKYYKSLRRKAYEALLEEGKASKALNRANKLYKDMRINLTVKLTAKANLLKRAKDDNLRTLDRAKIRKRVAVDDLKEMAWIAGLASSLGLGVHAGVQHSRKISRSEHMHALKESQGMENPNNGYYEYILREEGLSEKEIQLKLEEAKKLYHNNMALVKRKDGGVLKALFGINIPAVLNGVTSRVKNRIYRTITPKDYNIGRAAKEFISGKTRPLNNSPENEEWAKYLGINFGASSNFEPAIYRPTKGKTYDKVYKFKDESLILSDNVIKLLENNYKKTGKKSMLIKGNGTGLGSYTVSMGEDEKGKYISYYDDWDINPFKGISANYNIPIISSIEDIVPGSHPFSVYGRRYYKNGGKLWNQKAN